MAHTTQAFRTEFPDLEEEERFFISGVEKAGRSRNTYEHQLRKRKVLVGIAIGVGSLGLVALIIGLAWGLSRRDLNYDCPRTYQTGQAQQVFYVIGDWGRSGNENQRKVARLMADVSQCMPPKFVISTGDNFYPSGLSSVDDSLFTASFSSIYTAPGLQVPWYAVLGNHDYGDGSSDSPMVGGKACLMSPASVDACAGQCCFSPYWQTLPALAARDPRWNATRGVVTRTFPLGSSGDPRDALDIIFMDTSPFIQRYNNVSRTRWATFLYGISTQDSEQIRDEVIQQLNASYSRGSKWRLVVGHHPVRSYGDHCSQGADNNDCMDMAFMRAPLQRYRVAAYINGHEHDQQLIKSPNDPVHYVVSGAGSDIREGEFDSENNDERSTDALFLSDARGFLAVAIEDSNMRLYFYTTEQSEPTYIRVVPLPTW